jgi:carbon storage regulator
MLVLSRKIDESIIISDNIEIKIIDIIGERVKIGIEAPKNVTIFREEISQKIKKNKMSSRPSNLRSNRLSGINQ